MHARKLSPVICLCRFVSSYSTQVRKLYSWNCTMINTSFVVRSFFKLSQSQCECWWFLFTWTKKNSRHHYGENIVAGCPDTSCNTTLQSGEYLVRSQGQDTSQTFVTLFLNYAFCANKSAWYYYRHACDGSSVWGLFNTGELCAMQENRTNFYNTSATQITTVRMATITNFQVVQQTAIALSLALLDIQNTVQQVSPQDPLASCYTVREPVLVKPNDFLTNSIFRFLVVSLLISVTKSWRTPQILRSVSILFTSHIF